MQAAHVGVVHKDAPCSDKMQAVASSSQDLPLRKQEGETSVAESRGGLQCLRNRGYDPQKHREMSKSYAHLVHSFLFPGTRGRFLCDSGGWCTILA